jgi:hypothetical protein
MVTNIICLTLGYLTRRTVNLIPDSRELLQFHESCTENTADTFQIGHRIAPSKVLVSSRNQVSSKAWFHLEGRQAGVD